MKTKNLTLKKLGTSIFLYVIIYIVIYLLAYFILKSQGLIYLQWFQYVSYTLIGLGIIAGTFQWIVKGYKTDHYRIKVGVMLLVIETVVALVLIIVFYTCNNRESIVNKNGTYYITKADGELFDKYAEAGDVSGMYSILDKYNIPHA